MVGAAVEVMRSRVRGKRIVVERCILVFDLDGDTGLFKNYV